MIQRQGMEGSNVAVTDKEEIIRLEVFGLQLARFTLGFHGRVGILHAGEVNVAHGLADRFFPVDAAQFLVVEEQDTDLEDVWHQNQRAGRARAGIVVS